MNHKRDKERKDGPSSAMSLKGCSSAATGPSGCKRVLRRPALVYKMSPRQKKKSHNLINLFGQVPPCQIANPTFVPLFARVGVRTKPWLATLAHGFVLTPPLAHEGTSLTTRFFITNLEELEVLNLKKKKKKKKTSTFRD